MKPLLEFKLKGTTSLEWEKFLKDVIVLMDERDHAAFVDVGGWESDAYPGRHHAMQAYNWLEHSYNTIDLETVRVFPFKKQGITIEASPYIMSFKNRKSFTFIRACKTGFHRDWDHDAVCVKDQPWEPHEPMNHPEGYTRQELES
jgi:hypothetical protein